MIGLEAAMGEPFNGTINLDIRDSAPDWAPFQPPKAPQGEPSVVYIVLDDVGFSAMGCYGGPIETPNIDRIAAQGVRYTQWHTTALCSPTRSCLLTGRNHTCNSMACITEAAVGFPNAGGTIPPENGMIAEILGELGWNTYDLICEDRVPEPPARLVPQGSSRDQVGPLGVTAASAGADAGPYADPGQLALVHARLTEIQAALTGVQRRLAGTDTSPRDAVTRDVG
jgi:hypothetical protein